MDFIKDCTTSVLVTSGFSVIHYKVYELLPKDGNLVTSSSSDTKGESATYKEYKRVRAVRQTEWALRCHDALVTVDGTGQLWVFGRSQKQIMEKLSSCATNQDLDQSFAIDGLLSFTFKRAGSVSAADLLRDPISRPDPGLPRTAVSLVDIDGEIDGQSPSGSQPAVQPGELQVPYYRLHHFFIAACVQSVILQLSRTSQAIPLNFRTVVLNMERNWDADQTASISPHWATLAGLDLSFTQKGDIVVSLHVEPAVVRALSKGGDEDSISSDEHPRVVRIAPSGRLARTVAPRGSKYKQSDSDRSQSLHGETLSGKTWRDECCGFLASRGIVLQHIQNHTSWSSVRLLGMPLERPLRREPEAKPSADLEVFEWPSALCFEYRCEETDVTANGLFHGRQDDEDWRKDMLDEALEVGKAFGDDVDMQDSDRLQDNTSRLGPRKSFEAEMNWQPPSYKQASLLDLDKAIAVYPTPPDGLLPSSNDTAGSPSVQINAEHPPPCVRTAHTQETAHEQRIEQDQSVTEADFDFFNDPIVTEDVEMPLYNQEAHNEQQRANNGHRADSQPPQVMPSSLEGVKDSMAVLDVDESMSQSMHGDLKSTDPLALGKDACEPSFAAMDVIAASKNDTMDVALPSHNPRYEPVDLHDLDGKYNNQGRFANMETTVKGHDSSSRKASKPFTPSTLYEAAASSKRSTFTRTKHGLPMDSSGSDNDSDEVEVLPQSHNQVAGENLSTALKRPRLADEPLEDGRGRLQDDHEQAAIDSGAERRALFNFMFLRMVCRSSPADWSLTNFPFPNFRSRISKAISSLRPAESIEVSQLVSAQLSTSTLDHGEHFKDPYLVEASVVEQSVTLLRSVLEQALGSADEPIQQDPLLSCAIDSVVLPVKTSKFQPKPVVRREKASGHPASTRADLSTSMFDIPVPNIRLQRGQEAWEFFPSVTTFWDTLGVSPAHGPKHIKALCVFPENKIPADKVLFFMEALNRTWSRDRLGSHEMLETLAIPEGLIGVNTSDTDTLGSAMKEYTEQFLDADCGHEALLSLFYPEIPAIYMINPFSNEDGIFNLCHAFHTLLKELSISAHFILQVIPIRQVFSVVNLEVPGLDLSILAREVYDRCPASYAHGDLPITSQSAIIIAEQPSDDINLQLIADAPFDVMREHSCMHIAYCRSLDDNWITAAWTDDLGEYQHQAAYYMGKGQSLKTVAREIWESTLEYISPRRTQWRLFIVCVGPMPLVERRIWREIAVQTTKKKTKLALTLVSVSTSPMMDIYPKPTFRPSVVNTNREADDVTSTPIPTPHNAFITTPTATPSAAASTPAAHGPSTPFNLSTSFTNPGLASSPAPLTPALPNPPITFDIDPTARLIDLTDESVGIVLSRHLNVSHSIIDHHPALASGYLVKRTGTSELDMPVCLEVNIMAVDLGAGSSSSSAGQMQGRKRSGSDPVPAAASRGQQGLAQLPPKPPTPVSARAGGATSQRGGILAATPTPSTATPSTATTSASASARPQPPSSQYANTTNDTAVRLAARQKRYDAVLREVLVKYRNLALLAKVRGIQGVRGTSPWHVVVVQRAAEGLRRCVGGLGEER